MNEDIDRISGDGNINVSDCKCKCIIYIMLLLHDVSSQYNGTANACK
jgi:hypothetical protein